MKRFASALLLATAAGVYCAPAASADISIYGHIDIGGLPQPPVLISPAPVVIERTRVVEEPIYMHVPPGHAKHWSKHCHEYRACGRPVYFVKDDWYQRVYVNEYKRRPGPPAHEYHGGPDHPPGPPHGGGKHDHGPGNGKGKGHGPH